MALGANDKILIYTYTNRNANSNYNQITFLKKKNLSDWQGSQNVKYAVWEGSEETGVLCHGW